MATTKYQGFPTYRYAQIALKGSNRAPQVIEDVPYPGPEEEVVNTTTNTKDMNAHMTIDNDYVSNSNGFSSPVKEAELEVNYENNVTALYDAISNSQWNKALGTLQHSPLEARTWVVRYKEDNTKGVMWRFLPLHSACARQPPNAVISALLQAYPGGAGSCDDQGMVSSKERSCGVFILNYLLLLSFTNVNHCHCQSFLKVSSALRMW